MARAKKYDTTKKYKEAGLKKTKSGYKVTSFFKKLDKESKLPAGRYGTILTPPGTKLKGEVVRGGKTVAQPGPLTKSKTPRQARLYQLKFGADSDYKKGPRLSVGQYQQTVSERKRTAGRMASVEGRKKQISAYQSAVKKKAAPKNTGKKNRLR
jgi:hypothetical protein